jgi:hypothetical protein
MSGGTLLLYNPSAGEGGFLRFDGFGGITPLKTHAGWRSSWKQIIPGFFSTPLNTISLLFYDEDGTGEFYGLDHTLAGC